METEKRVTKIVKNGNSIKCPICGGTGSICEPLLIGKEMKLKSVAAKQLRKEGYSIREIMKIMAYKSPRSVVELINKKY